jgi:hypothetical protein
MSRQRFIRPLFVGILLAAALTLPGLAQTSAPSKAALTPVVYSAVASDLSMPLRDMKRIPPPWEAVESEAGEVPNRLLPKADKSRAPERLQADTAVQSWPGTTATPAPYRNWEGIGNLGNVVPPDTQGDVGLNHYVQWVNLSLAIWDKNGTLVYGPVNGNTLWQGFGGPCDACNDGDPVVIYDHLANRWLVSQFALPNYPAGPFYEYVAISQTSDPTGAWYRYAFKTSDTKMDDYPKLGAWSDAYYMTCNQFDTGGRWAGAGVLAFEKAKMLTGDPGARIIYFDLATVNTGYGGMLPAHLEGNTAPPAGAPCPFGEVDDDSWGWPHDQFSVWLFHADWTTPANSTFGLSGNPNVVLQTAPFSSYFCGLNGCIHQPGTSRGLDELSDRLMYRLQYRNFGDHQSLVTCHTVNADGAGTAGVRWYELRSTGGDWSILQQGTYAPDGTSRWMGSVAMNGQGAIGVGYSASSDSVYPSIRYAGRLVSDPLGTMNQAEQVLKAGTGVQTTSYSRWGDYSSLSVDPVDDCTFWYTQEYIATTGDRDWQTRVGAFRLADCSSSGGLTVTASATPSSGPIPLAVSLSATASGGTGPYTYAWTFGDGSTGTGVTVSHTYAARGSYSAQVTATDSQSHTGTGVAYVTALAQPPVITSVTKLANPLRLKVSGTNFHSNFNITGGGAPLLLYKYKSTTEILLKGPEIIKSVFPKGVPVAIVITNNDDGGVSAPFTYTR